MNGRSAVDDASLAVRIGGRLRLLRRAKGLTLAALSARSGVSVSYLSAVEKGINHPSLQTLAAVTEALGVRIPEVLVEEGQAHVRQSRIPEGPRATVSVSHPLLQLRSSLVVAAAGDVGDCPVSVEDRDLFVYVVEGRIEVVVDGETVEVARGDALDAAAPDRVSWRSTGPSVTAWTSCPARTA